MAGPAGGGREQTGSAGAGAASAVVLLLAAAAVVASAWWAGVLPSWLTPVDTSPSPDGTMHVQDVEDARPSDQAVLHMTFDAQRRTSRAIRFRDSRGVWEGTVAGAQGGTVRLVQGSESIGNAVAFPALCRHAADCPRAMIEIPHHALLNPGVDDFSYGASLLLAEDNAAKGSNVVQKGRFSTPGGQWKLQVDTLDGRPSCVIQGEHNDERTLAVVRSDVSIADGSWHDVMCRKTAETVSIDVDGTTQGKRVRIGAVQNDSDVRIGSSGVGGDDDQYHGTVDDVFLTVGAPDAAESD